MSSSTFGVPCASAASVSSVWRRWSWARSPVPKPFSVSAGLCSGVSDIVASGSEDLRKVEECRPEDDEEHGRENEEHGREEHLDRRLHRLLLGGGLALEAAVVRLHAQNAAEGDAELVGLDDRPHEGGELRGTGAVGELLERVGARLADADLAQGQRELVRERAIHVLRQLRDRAIE